MKEKNIFVTGTIHIGKSTVIHKILNCLQPCKIGGLRTVPIFESGERTGFAIQPFNGKSQTFAHIDWRTPHKLYTYYYQPQVFETFAVSLLQQSLQGCDLIVIDEIGKMEANALQFCDAVVQCLDSAIPVLGAFQKRANWFWNIINRRSDVKVFEVTKSNRCDVSAEISTALAAIGIK
ncbi:MAG TPA: hypothetical protein ENN22_00260 [bacterium]|nr:hypothetical protein [bacterium]